MGQTDLARAGDRAAAGEARPRNRMVRRAEGARADDRIPAAGQSGDGVDLGRLDHLLPAHVRQDRGQTARHHRLAGARRTDAEHVVPAGRGDLEGALDALLTLDVGKIGQRQIRRRERRRRGGAKLLFAAQMGDQLAHALDAIDLHALGKGGLGGVFGREKELFHAAALRRDGHGQRAGDAPQRAVERKLAEKGAVRGNAGQLTLRREDADEDRQIIERAGLFPVGRGEIDRQTARREAKAVVLDRRADALARLLDGGVGQSDDLKAGQTAGDIDLDGDLKAAHAADGKASDTGKHALSSLHVSNKQPEGENSLAV